MIHNSSCWVADMVVGPNPDSKHGESFEENSRCVAAHNVHESISRQLFKSREECVNRLGEKTIEVFAFTPSDGTWTERLDGQPVLYMLYCRILGSGSACASRDK